MATTELISQTGALRAIVGTDLMEVEATGGGASARGVASGIGGLMPANTLTLAQLVNMVAAGFIGAAAAGATVALSAAQSAVLIATSLGLDSIVVTDTTITFTKTGADLVVRKIILPLE